MLRIISKKAIEGAICKSISMPIEDKNTGVFNTIQKVVLKGPKYKTLPVYAPNSKNIKYYKADIDFEGANVLNQETGKPATNYDAIMSLMDSAKIWLKQGVIAVAVTEDTVDAVKKAIKDGFPQNRINDSKGLLSPKNKEVEISKVEEVVIEEKIDDEEVTGVKDLKKAEKKETSPKK